jgi:hypothetical protein
MHKGPREKKERNSAIIRLHKNGMSAADVAAQFDISPGRVSAIVNKRAPVELCAFRAPAKRQRQTSKR